MGLTPENLSERRTLVGASEMAAVAGLSPWQTAIDIYGSKVAPVVLDESEDMERGNALEAALLDWTQHRQADIIIRPNETLYRCSAHPFLGATPDGLGFLRGMLDRPVKTVEVKSPGNPAEWTDPKEDREGYPIYYAVQVQIQLLCLGLDRALLSALVAPYGRGRLWVYEIKAHQDLQAELVAVAEEFWRHVENHEPPPVTRGSDGDVLARLFRQKTENLVVPPDEQREALRHAAATYKAMGKVETEAKTAKELARATLIAGIGEDAGVDLGDGWRATFKQTKGTTETNWQAIAREAGATDALVAKYTGEVPGYRRIHVAEPKPAKAAKKEG